VQLPTGNGKQTKRETNKIEKSEREKEGEDQGKKEEEGAEWRREENLRRERWNRRNAVTLMLHRASEEAEEKARRGR